jgi:hypothetical protein
MGVPMAHDEAYYQAEKKIEEAWCSKTTEIDCIPFEDFYLTDNTKGGEYDIS